MQCCSPQMFISNLIYVTLCVCVREMCFCLAWGLLFELVGVRTEDFELVRVSIMEQFYLAYFLS